MVFLRTSHASIATVSAQTPAARRKPLAVKVSLRRDSDTEKVACNNVGCFCKSDGVYFSTKNGLIVWISEHSVIEKSFHSKIFLRLKNCSHPLSGHCGCGAASAQVVQAGRQCNRTTDSMAQSRWRENIIHSAGSRSVCDCARAIFRRTGLKPEHSSRCSGSRSIL